MNFYQKFNRRAKNFKLLNFYFLIQWIKKQKNNFYFFFFFLLLFFFHNASAKLSPRYI